MAKRKNEEVEYPLVEAIIEEEDYKLDLTQGLPQVLRRISHCQTNPKYVKWRLARGGLQVPYISRDVFERVLNTLFQGKWSFIVTERKESNGEVLCFGYLKLTWPDGSTTEYHSTGSSDIKKAKGTGQIISIGDDYKSAESDCLKKAASRLGFFADVYSGLYSERVASGEVPGPTKTGTTSPQKSAQPEAPARDAEDKDGDMTRQDWVAFWTKLKKYGYTEDKAHEAYGTESFKGFSKSKMRLVFKFLVDLAKEAKTKKEQSNEREPF